MKLPDRLRLSPEWAPYVFVSPFIGLFLVFGVFPLAFSLYLAFQSWEPTSGLAAMQFVGFDNYVFALRDEWFWKSLKNTAWLALASGVPQHLVAIPLAYFIHSSFKRLRNAVVGAYFMPYITSTVAIAILFSSLFSTDFGLINVGLQALNQVPVLGWLVPDEAIDWLNDPDRIKPAIAMLVFWRYVGFNVVLPGSVADHPQRHLRGSHHGWRRPPATVLVHHAAQPQADDFLWRHAQRDWGAATV